MYAIRGLLVSSLCISLDKIADADLRGGTINNSKIVFDSSVQKVKCVNYSNDNCGVCLCLRKNISGDHNFHYYFTATGSDLDKVEDECRAIKHLLQAKSLSHVHYRNGIKIEPPRMLRAANH